MEPIGAIESEAVDALPVSGSGGEVVGLNDGPVVAEELEVDLVLTLVAFEGGEVEVEVEAAGVAAGALDEGAEGSVEEPGRGAPPGPSAVVVGEGYGVGVGTVGTGLWGVVYRDLLQRLGLWVKHWIRHCLQCDL